MKEQGTGGGKNDTLSEMLSLVLSWEILTFNGRLDCSKMHSMLFCSTHFLSQVFFYPPPPLQISSFQMFSGGIERFQWHKIG